MNYKVIYFTRTGNSRRIAEKIAHGLSCDVIRLTDQVNWKGALGCFNAVKYILSKKSVKFSLNSKNGKVENYDALVVVTPIWASKPTPTVLQFLKTVSASKVHLVYDSGSTKMKDVSRFASVRGITKKSKNEDSVIHSLVETLKAR